MKGSLRIITGLLIAFGAVGGVESATDNLMLLATTATAVVGLAIMAWGASALNKNQSIVKC